MFTARVQGHGLVDWTPEQVDAYGLLSTHRPAGGWLPRRRTSCRDCGHEWPCVWATWAELQGGVPARIVQERLGHADIKITMMTYTHVMPGQQRGAAESVASLVKLSA